jgi:polysaccharide biosynthesis transport protein
MTPLHFLLALRARYKVVLLFFFATVVVVMAVGSRLPTRYAAMASVMVDVRASDPLTAMIMPASLNTQIEIIQSDRVSRRVIKMLKLDEDRAVQQRWLEARKGGGIFESLRLGIFTNEDAVGDHGPLEDWLVDSLQKNLKATAGRDSNIINIVFQGPDPSSAAAIANAYAQGYIDTIIEMKVEPAKQYARWFQDQTRALRENVEKAQSRLSQYQQSKGIVERDERMDYETTKLRELSSQLTILQSQTTESRSKQKSGQDTLPEIMQNGMIAGLKTDINHREATLQEAALNLGKNHPQYQRMESELASLKQKLEVETQHITRSFWTASEIGQSRESELMAAIEAQKKKLLALKNERDEIAVRQREVESATQAYDAVNARFNQTTLESQATRANVSLLTPAVAPRVPSSPKPLHVMLMIAMVLGALLGLGTAVGLEFLDWRIRSAEDLAEMLQVPVLGVIERVRMGRRISIPSIPIRRLR